MTDSLSALAARWRDTKAQERETMADLHAAIRDAHAAGVPLLQIERATGLNRRTVRAAAGLGNQWVRNSGSS